MNIAAELAKTAESFRTRFNEVVVFREVGFDVVSFIKDYIDHREYGLAFETLCQNLLEYDIALSEEEYVRLEHLGNELYPESDHDWYRLKELIAY